MRSFLKVYFIDNVIRVVLTCPPCLPLPSASHSLRQSPHHCSRPWVVHRSSLASPFPTALYTPTGSSVTAYLFLISSPLPPFCPSHLTAGNLPVTNFFSLAAFKSSSFSLTFGFVTMMCLGVGLFASIIIGTLCASWTCMSIPFTNLGKLSFTVFFREISNFLPFLFLFWHSYEANVGPLKGVPGAAYTVLIFFFFFGFFFSSCCSDWLIFFLPYVPNH